MRGKIERFSIGEFEYEQPELCLSEAELRCCVEIGTIYQGTFVIENQENHMMKGMVYSSHGHLTIEQPSFYGINNTIRFQFDATYRHEEEEISGEIVIVSDCGEEILPFLVQVVEPYFETSYGKINQLDQFVKLARMDWTEAKKIFRSERFENTFFRRDDNIKILYHNLQKSISTSQALEEFLVATQQKPKLKLKVDKTTIDYKFSDKEPIVDKITVSKDQWGYAEVKVHTDVPFIKLDQKFDWSDSFIGNMQQINYILDPKLMNHGENIGWIYINTIHQELTIQLHCVCEKEKKPTTNVNTQKELHRFQVDFVKNYLQFRMDQKCLEEYIVDTDRLIEVYPAVKSKDTFDLIKAHLAMVSGSEDMAHLFLDHASDLEEYPQDHDYVAYSAYMYLIALLKKDSPSIEKASTTIRNIYDKKSSDWRILWFLLYIDNRYERNHAYKLHDIKEQFLMGCRSPILYYEAICVYNEEPFLLRELTEFEIQTMNFGIKNNLLSQDLVLQFTYLANKMKVFRGLVFQQLKRLYEVYGTEDLLSTICSHLIKGIKKGEEYFEWYRLGVEKQLRITGMYEYYMYSVREDRIEPLAESVLLYFIYSNHLNDKKLAFLYANIVRNKDVLVNIYRSYSKRIEVFALKQMEAHHISRDLAVLYRELLENNELNETMAKQLPYVMFQKELTCSNPNIVAVSVVHKESQEAETVPLSEGKALIPRYTENSYLLFLDQKGNRYYNTIEYTIQDLLPYEEYGPICAEYSDHPRLMYYLCSKARDFHPEQAALLRKQVILYHGISDEFRSECLLELVHYYQERNEFGQVQNCLLQIDWLKAKEEDRITIIEFYIQFGLYQKAKKAMEHFGYLGVAPNLLVIFCSDYLSHLQRFEKKELLLKQCHYVFNHKIYNEEILNYLIHFYEGSIEEMFQIWQAARNFQMDTRNLEERILTQILYVERKEKRSMELFQTYYKNVSNHKLVNAFLTYYAVQFLLYEEEIEEILPIIKRELNYDENDICMMAVLKYYEKNQSILTESDLNFVDYQVNRFVKKGILLPFFQGFRNIMKLPYCMMDKTYIQYKSNPNRKVFIHYRFIQTSASQKEQMQKPFQTEQLEHCIVGIHVKGFIILYDEMLEYYITEEFEGEVIHNSRICSIPFQQDLAVEENTKYNQLNQMRKWQKESNEEDLLSSMEHYVKMQYFATHYFEPMEEGNL